MGLLPEIGHLSPVRENPDIGALLAPEGGKELCRMRHLGLAVILFAIPSVCFGSVGALHASSAPQPGLLALLGSGLIGMAGLIRRLLSE